MYNYYKLNYWFGGLFLAVFEFEFELDSLIVVFEFELDSLNILLSKLIHLKWRSLFLLKNQKQTNKQKSTVCVDSKLKNWDNYENFRSLAGFKSKHVVLGPSKIAA